MFLVSRKKKKIVAYIVLFALVAFLGSALATALANTAKSNEKAREYVNALKEDYKQLEVIWGQIDAILQSWRENKIDRQGIAERTVPLLVEFNQLNERFNQYKSALGKDADTTNVKTCSLYYNGLLLKTEIMLYDMAKGYNVPDNPYAYLKPMTDEVLNHVYQPRKTAYEKDVKMFLELLAKFS